MELKVNNIYNMDFRLGLKLINSKIDLIATDPPYNIDFKYNDYQDSLEEKIYIDMIASFRDYPLAIIHYPEETMRYFIPALGVPSEVAIWCYNSNLPRQSRLINFYNTNVDFNKVKQPYKNLKDKRIIEAIEKGSKGAKIYDWFSDIQQVKNVSKEKGIHPCPVPVDLMERIILLTTNEGDLVVDPFSGSGTTAIACINTKRKYIGFEISEEYHKVANKRINLAKSQISVYDLLENKMI